MAKIKLVAGLASFNFEIIFYRNEDSENLIFAYDSKSKEFKYIKRCRGNCTPEQYADSLKEGSGTYVVATRGLEE